MAQIINEPGIGELLGTGIGQGAASGLQQLANLKTQQLLEGYKHQLMAPQRQAFAQALQGILGAGESPLGQPQNESAVSGLPSPATTALPMLDEHQALELAKLKQKADKAKQEESKANISFNKEVIDTIRNKARAAKEVVPVLKRGIELSKRGNIRNEYLTTALDKLGINSEAFMNGDTLELQKLTNYVLRGASKIFGGKVSNFEAQQLLRGFPNLYQSNEGRIQLAQQLLKTAELEEKEGEVFRNIIKKNKNRVPFDLEEQIEQEMRPYYDEYVKSFVNAPSGGTQRFDSLPDAKQYEGKKIRDTDTGQILISRNGTWVKE